MKFSRIQTIATAFQVVRSMGLKWTFSRARGMIDARTNALERCLPSAPWNTFEADVGLDQFRARSIWPISHSAASQFEALHPDSKLPEQFERLVQGHFALFGGKERELGWPPDWRRNADDDRKIPSQDHFSKISTFAHGDIKNFWEPARFGFVWILCRAHFAGLTNESGRLFFQAVTDFAEKNPAFQGPQWMCGQEAALRAAAIAAGWSVFREHASDQQTRTVIQLLIATAKRIAVHLDYALSQKNNHGLSEAMGLLLVGLAVPEHPDAKRWLDLGRLTLESEASRLVDPDGGFSQQSASYHRVMVHVLVAAVSIARHHAVELPRCVAALQRSSQFVSTLLVSNGKQPRYGHDDGACVLDWTGCAYDDFRPSLQEACFASGVPLPNKAGPWDVGLAWLGAVDPTILQRREPVHQPVAVLHHAGLVALRDKDAFASMRVPPAVYRPGQVDAMHVDVWLKGHTIALDPGTFRYNASGNWSTIPLALGRYHNVVTSGDADLAKRVGRFLYVPWPKATVRTETSPVIQRRNAVTAKFANSIGKIQEWNREVSVNDCEVEVVDSIQCRSSCPISLRWQLSDGPIDSTGRWDGATVERLQNEQLPNKQPSNEQKGHWMRWQTAAGLAELAVTVDHPAVSVSPIYQRASESAAGWYAPRYGELAPCHTVTTEIDSRTATELQIRSRFRIISNSHVNHSKEPA